MADLRKNIEERGPLLEGNDSGERAINDSGTNIDPVGLSEGHENDLLSGDKNGKDEEHMGEDDV